MKSVLLNEREAHSAECMQDFLNAMADVLAYKVGNTLIGQTLDTILAKVRETAEETCAKQIAKLGEKIDREEWAKAIDRDIEKQKQQEQKEWEEEELAEKKAYEEAIKGEYIDRRIAQQYLGIYSEAGFLKIKKEYNLVAYKSDDNRIKNYYKTEDIKALKAKLDKETQPKYTPVQSFN